MEINWINVLFGFDFWLVLIGGLVLVRAIMVIFAAEQGRKHDLVKKLYKANQEFHLSVLVPCQETGDLPYLLALMQAIREQDYPANRVAVHLAVPEELRGLLEVDPLPKNIRLWPYPSQTKMDYAQGLTWLIDRCLAVGGSGMFIFLKPTDMIKSDFFQNVVANGYDSYAIQGYVALKNQPANLISKVNAVSSRLVNRIGNAGRFHLGLGCRLLDSGWAVKQELLEMIPFHRGQDTDNLEYTLRLAAENYRVKWAPNVVVYSDAQVSLIEQTAQCLGAIGNRLGMFLRYTPRLLSRSLTRFDFSYMEWVLLALKPPMFISGLFLAAIALYAYLNPSMILGDWRLWVVGVVGLVTIQALAMGVARCRGEDFATMLLGTPIAYALGALVSPIALFTLLSNRPSSGRARGYRRKQTTRFNEELIAPPKHVKAEAPLSPIETILREEPQPAPRKPLMNQPREQVKEVQLTNGKKAINCRLRTETVFDAEGRANYQLTLEYKTMAFSTASYRILDQAFYELQSKLMVRGLTMLTCGSCGNFYNPTADIPGAMNNSGVCLFGKTGKEVNLKTDAVTVLSQACPYHCTLEDREKIVRQWKDSLSLSKSRS